MELSRSQKENLVGILLALPSAVQDAYPACNFNPHHTVRFYRRGKLESSMAICFECGQVQWEGTKKDPIWSLYGGLARFVESIGMRTKADGTSGQNRLAQ
jgi:hypothetical protein